jgi:hypothetical protein
MPNFSWLGRRDTSAIEDATLAALLSGTELPGDLPAGLQPAADVVAALRARPASDELVGETVALAEFRARVGVSDPAGQRRRRRPSLLTSLVSAKAVAAAAVVAITVGGVATAAYAGALPSSAQRIAHELIDAPQVHKTTTHTTSAKLMARPKVSHRAVPALCLAFWRTERSGTKAQKAAAFSKLEKAAGGANKIAAYCGFARRRPVHHRFFRPGCRPMFPHPSWSAHPQPSWSPSARPSSSPSPMPTPTASCAPLTHPVGKPFPHRHRPFPIGKHFPPRPGKPSRPVGKPAK